MTEVNPADKILRANDAKVVGGSTDYPQLFGDIDLRKIYSDILTDPDDPIVSKLEKEQGEEAQPTNTQSMSGMVNQCLPRPVDITAIRRLKDVSPHHASCIQSKKYSSLGLGFVSDASDVENSKGASATTVQDTENKVMSLLTGESYVESKVDKKLDPLTMYGFMHELYKVCEDFLDGGSGYIEVVRDKDDKIIGLNWMPYEELQVATVKDKEGKTRIVYQYQGTSYFTGYAGVNRYYSLFGKANRKWVWDTCYDVTNADSQMASQNDAGEASKDDVKRANVTIDMVSEIIPFMVPSNRSRYYGYPEWLAASPVITLLSMAMQYKSDFYTNKGVLAYIFSIMGNVDGDKWKAIEALIQGSVGGGNNFKNLAVQVADPKAKVQLDKLASEDKTEMQFASDSEVFAQNIVSAHRVPPVLANILISGKLGAANETIQALVSYQLLVIGPIQAIFQKTLARTLTGPDGVPGLNKEDFRFRTITSQFNIAGLDTVGRAREEAVGSDRDFSTGVRE